MSSIVHIRGFSRKLAVTFFATFAILVATVAVGVSGASTKTPGVAKSQISVGVVASLGGGLGSQDAIEFAAFSAAIDAQNAAGGVYGRRINLVVEDDQSSTSGNLSATRSLVQVKKVFAIAEINDDMNAGFPFLKANKVPVVATAVNPILGTQPYTNSFANTGSVDPNGDHYVSTTGVIMKSLGVTHLGALGLLDIPTSDNVVASTTLSAQAAGISSGYSNDSIPVGESDWTPYIQAMQSAGVNGLVVALDPPGFGALESALKQNGISWPVLSVSGDVNANVQAPAVTYMQGMYSLALFAPPQLGTAAGRAEDAALLKYAGITYPAGFEESMGYTTGLLLIKGLELAGRTPTRASFITNLRHLKNWTANGLQPKPVNFQTVFGHNVTLFGNGDCDWVLKVSGSKFVPIQQAPFCGTTLGS